jgi:hypothetical protein
MVARAVQPFVMQRRDRAHPREHPRPGQDALGVVGMQAHPFPFARGQRARLAPNAQGHADSAQIVQPARPPHGDHVGGWQPALPGGSRHQLGHTARMAEQMRRHQVREVGQRLRRAVHLFVREAAMWPWLGRQHRLPGRAGLQLGQHDRRHQAEPRHDRRVVGAARALARHSDGRLDPTQPAEGLGILREMHDTCGARQGFAFELAGRARHTLPIPPRIHLPERVLNGRLEAQPLGKVLGDLAVRAPVLRHSGEEPGKGAGALERGLARADVAEQPAEHPAGLPRIEDGEI